MNTKKIFGLLIATVMISAFPLSITDMNIDGEDKMIGPDQIRTIRISENKTVSAGDTLTVEGTLIVEGTLTINGGVVVNNGGSFYLDKGGKINGSGTISGTASQLLTIRGGTVEGLTFTMGTSVKHAIVFSTDSHGDAAIDNCRIEVSDDADVANCGIYVNQRADRIKITNITFNFNKKEMIAVNTDTNNDCDVIIENLTYNEPNRTNLVLVNATTDITLGNGEDVNIKNTDNVILWCAGNGNVFTIPEGKTFDTSGVVTVHSDTNLIVSGVLGSGNNGYIKLSKDPNGNYGKIIVNEGGILSCKVVSASEDYAVFTGITSGDGEITLSSGSIIIDGGIVSSDAGRIEVSGTSVFTGTLSPNIVLELTDGAEVLAGDLGLIISDGARIILGNGASLGDGAGVLSLEKGVRITVANGQAEILGKTVDKGEYIISEDGTLAIYEEDGFWTDVTISIVIVAIVLLVFAILFVIQRNRTS